MKRTHKNGWYSTGEIHGDKRKVVPGITGDGIWMDKKTLEMFGFEKEGEAKEPFEIASITLWAVKDKDGNISYKTTGLDNLEQVECDVCDKFSKSEKDRYDKLRQDLEDYVYDCMESCDAESGYKKYRHLSRRLISKDLRQIIKKHFPE